MSAEAWKDTGNCRECRRRKYCKSECRASREAAQKRANEIVRSFMRANAILPNMKTKERMITELRSTEIAITGECSVETAEKVYNQCYDLAVHSTFSVFSIVSVLCAECKNNKESIKIGILSMDEKLRAIRARGL